MSAATTQRRVSGMHGDYTVVGEAISKGGVGAIYRTTDPKWVYKQYHSPDKAPPPADLERLVAVGRDVLIRQGLEIGAQPESSINWPVDIVRTPDGKVIGCVLPAIPQRYFHPTLGTVNTIDFLIMRRASPPPAMMRLIVLLRMAEILAFVHSKRLVHGDVNAKNVAWTIDPEPAAYLIDCDGMVPQDPPPKVGVQASFWTDPRVADRVIPAHDQYSDWYCLALAFYRGLLLLQGGNLGKQNGVWQAPGQIPNDLDPRIAELMRRGLTDPLDPSKRPEPAEWRDALVAVYVQGNKFDEPALAKLDKALSMPKPKPVTPGPAFQPLPPTTQYRPTTPSQQQQRPTTPPPPPRPQYQQPTYQQPVPPQPQPTGQWQQTPPPPPPQYAPTYGQPSPFTAGPTAGVKPPGALARWAMEGGAKWYASIALMTLFCLPVGAVVGAIVLFQTWQAEPHLRGRTAALVSSGIAVAIGVLFLLTTLAGNGSSPSK